jgi:hypothetical protein
MEQAAAPAPSGTTAPTTTATTTVKKLSKEELDKLRDCSGFNSKKLPGLTSGSTENNYTIYNLQGKPFCKDNMK